MLPECPLPSRPMPASPLPRSPGGPTLQATSSWHVLCFFSSSSPVLIPSVYQCWGGGVLTHLLLGLPPPMFYAFGPWINYLTVHFVLTSFFSFFPAVRLLISQNNPRLQPKPTPASPSTDIRHRLLPSRRPRQNQRCSRRCISLISLLSHIQPSQPLICQIPFGAFDHRRIDFCRRRDSRRHIVNVDFSMGYEYSSHISL
jgi:hypothetical protein